MMSVDLRKLFLHLQTQLATRLQGNREILDHPSAKGAATEEGWRQMLEDYLPKRYCVAKAFVIDGDGDKSEEIDLVIHDRQYSPFLFNQDGAIYIPAESVYGVFEVKQSLSAETIDYAIQKAASVRRLTRTSVTITHAGGKFEPRPPFPILAGLLSLESDWKPPLGEPLAKRLEAGPGRLDLICALRHGTAEATYSVENPLRLELSAPDSALIFFFLRLLDRLQGLGTVPAIDLRKYGKALAS
ncbi:MAG TPA: DUF6602 domain-containing protein [Thermoanaerobaculia bacterium]|jgi:hypothetical protein|nr:DUF6602 domain-containing protein [Thermoanaerobaculia bacterium]